jgi:hypothetical protein
MPACSAASTGALNACRSISDTAIPSTPLATAVFTASTIWLTLLLSEPVHTYLQPSRLHASASAYCVGTKNELVVTWLTTVNLYSGCEPNTFEEPLPPEALDPQALSRLPTEPAATPVSAVRRRNARRSKPGRAGCTRSTYSSRWTAS